MKKNVNAKITTQIKYWLGRAMYILKLDTNCKKHIWYHRNIFFNCWVIWISKSSQQISQKYMYFSKSNIYHVIWDWWNFDMNFKTAVTFFLSAGFFVLNRFLTTDHPPQQGDTEEKNTRHRLVVFFSFGWSPPRTKIQ